MEAKVDMIFKNISLIRGATERMETDKIEKNNQKQNKKIQNDTEKQLIRRKVNQDVGRDYTLLDSDEEEDFRTSDTRLIKRNSLLMILILMSLFFQVNAQIVTSCSGIPLGTTKVNVVGDNTVQLKIFNTVNLKLHQGSCYNLASNVTDPVFGTRLFNYTIRVDQAQAVVKQRTKRICYMMRILWKAKSVCHSDFPLGSPEQLAVYQGKYEISAPPDYTATEGNFVKKFMGPSYECDSSTALMQLVERFLPTYSSPYAVKIGYNLNEDYDTFVVADEVPIVSVTVTDNIQNGTIIGQYIGDPAGLTIKTKDLNLNGISLNNFRKSELVGKMIAQSLDNPDYVRVITRFNEPGGTDLNQFCAITPENRVRMMSEHVPKALDASAISAKRWRVAVRAGWVSPDEMFLDAPHPNVFSGFKYMMYLLDSHYQNDKDFISTPESAWIGKPRSEYNTDAGWVLSPTLNILSGSTATGLLTGSTATNFASMVKEDISNNTQGSVSYNIRQIKPELFKFDVYGTTSYYLYPLLCLPDDTCGQDITTAETGTGWKIPDWTNIDASPYDGNRRIGVRVAISTIPNMCDFSYAAYYTQVGQAGHPNQGSWITSFGTIKHTSSIPIQTATGCACMTINKNTCQVRVKYTNREKVMYRDLSTASLTLSMEGTFEIDSIVKTVVGITSLTVKGNNSMIDVSFVASREGPIIINTNPVVSSSSTFKAVPGANTVSLPLMLNTNETVTVSVCNMDNECKSGLVKVSVMDWNKATFWDFVKTPVEDQLYEINSMLSDGWFGVLSGLTSIKFYSVLIWGAGALAVLVFANVVYEIFNFFVPQITNILATSGQSSLIVLITIANWLVYLFTLRFWITVLVFSFKTGIQILTKLYSVISWTISLIVKIINSGSKISSSIASTKKVEEMSEPKTISPSSTREEEIVRDYGLTRRRAKWSPAMVEDTIVI